MPEDRTPFDDLEARLRAARAKQGEGAKAEPAGTGPLGGMGLGLRLGVEMMAGIAVGGGIGFGLDRVCGTRPWLMAMFLILGLGAGVANAWRAAHGVDETVGLQAARERAGLLEDDGEGKDER